DYDGSGQERLRVIADVRCVRTHECGRPATLSPERWMNDKRGRKEKGDRVGPWLLDERLGEGGNGEVWRASQQGEGQAALKILHARFQQVDHTRFERFRDEILTHSRLSGEPGVLPVIAHHLPECPSEEDPA